jgi:hypothetical protein
VSYESRTYDKSTEDGFPPEPVLVLVATGWDDVARLAWLLNGGSPAMEHYELGKRINRQLSAHSAGKEALALLHEHGGPDFTEREMDIYQRVIAATTEGIRFPTSRHRAILAVTELHHPVGIYDDCGHVGHHEYGPDGAVPDGLHELQNIGLVCESGRVWTVCAECCCERDDHTQMTTVCDVSHDPGSATTQPCWPCPTVRAMAEAMGVAR